jgi:hypothetical protein
MITTFPSQFKNFEEWVECSEDLRRSWEQNQPWMKYTPESWIHIFPEMRNRVEELLLQKLDSRERIKKLYDLTEATFSKNLNERLFEEALLDATLGKTLLSLDAKIKVYRRMLFDNSSKSSGVISQTVISQAKSVPMESLIDQPIKRGQILCPFHHEKTPSCKVYPDHIHCFGCGKSLDTIGYIMETQGLSFIDSVKFLCKI